MEDIERNVSREKKANFNRKLLRFFACVRFNRLIEDINVGGSFSRISLCQTKTEGSYQYEEHKISFCYL